MRIDPVLRALADDPAPQHAAQTKVLDALLAWRAESPVAGVLAELARYGDGAPLAGCARLASLMTEPEQAAAFAASLVRAFAPVLAAEPLARMPFRQASQAGSASLVLGHSGRAMLSLAVREPGMVAYEGAGFADGERYDMVLAGAGSGAVVRRGADGAFTRQPIALAPGLGLSLDTTCESVLIETVSRALVSLRLTRLAEAPRPSREYRLSDGRLMVQAAGDPRASRHEMMLAVLGRMGRSDAAPVLAAMASEGCEHVRWQALRECLALDTAAGFRALAAIARDPADALAAPAGALHVQLLNAHPRLADLEAQPCPA